MANEKESRVNRDNYIVVNGFMVTDLKLKGNELLIYALIYGFSQAENQKFTGSLQYIADWTNSTRQGVLKAIKSLVEKGLLIKENKNINGVNFVEYCATKFNGGVKQSLTGCATEFNGGVKQSLHNNIDNNASNNLSNKKERKKAASGYDDIIKSYTENENLQQVLYEFIKMRKLIKKPLTDYALNNIIKKLDKLAQDDGRKIAILNQSICNNWQGIFELKETYSSATKTSNYKADNAKAPSNYDDAANDPNYIGF